MLHAEKGPGAAHDGAGLVIGIVQARFNRGVTDALVRACREELAALGVAADAVDLVTVPGALEIPLALQALAERDRYDALIAIGSIVRGETYHFELVANESGAGVTRVALDHGIPVANAILTTDDLAQAEARQHDKGTDAAQVAVEMARLLQSLDRA